MQNILRSVQHEILIGFDGTVYDTCDLYVIGQVICEGADYFIVTYEGETRIVARNMVYRQTVAKGSYERLH